MKTLPLSFLYVVLAITAQAEITYQQTTQMTGGALLKMPFSGRLKQPIDSTTVIKGNRMAHISKDSGMIWDLDKETITNVDYKSSTYSVMTFAEMKAMYEKMLNNVSDAGKKNQVDMTYDVQVNETGNTKMISGYSAREVVMTIVMKMADPKSGQGVDTKMENHIWLSKDVPAGKELMDFHRRMATKIGFSADTFRSIQANPQTAKAMAAMASKAGTMEGFHLMSVTKMMMSPEMTAQMAQASEAGAKARADMGTDVKTSTEDAAEQSVASAVASRLGKFGGIGAAGLGGLSRGRRKAEADAAAPKAQATTAKVPDAEAGVMSEMTLTTTSISATADVSKLAVPAGFKQVENKAEKSLRR